MIRVWSVLIASVGALGILTGLAMIRPSLALAPAVDTPYSEPPQLPTYKTLDELYEFRDRLQDELENGAEDPNAGSSEETASNRRDTLLQTLQAAEIRILIEETAIDKRDQALKLATEAVDLGKTPNPSIETLSTLESLWEEAVSSLEAVPEQSLVYQAAQTKREEYQKYHGIIAYRHDTARSGFLKSIAERTGLPAEDVHITVCHIEGECRRWQGDKPPASPASLIKLPIAIAVMEKATQEKIDLNTKITVSSGNYTEDASDIWAGGEYTLHKLLMRMINQSSNIATNQFIDYLGRDYINQVMSDRGYTVTRVNTKLVGESTYPANVGVGPNDMTTDELTDMMRRIYRLEHPGDDVLIDALTSQYDMVLGYDGLKGTLAIWMGEKTGQNSKVLGTVFAFSIDGELYTATVTLDYSANEHALRRCVNDIAQHIMKQGL